MVIGVLLIALGLALVVVGVRLFTERPRPLNLAGALIAPIGLAIALVGAGRLLSANFLG